MPIGLPNDNEEITSLLRERLEKEGIDFYLNHSVQAVSQLNNTKLVQIKSMETSKIIDLECSDLLIAAGRKANTESLNLEKAGIEFNKKGIVIDTKCKTNISNIYACGDVSGKLQFTHMAEHSSKVAVMNMILRFPMKINKNVPWVTYTDPEVAHVGSTEKELKENNITYEIYKFPFNKVDRAITESEDEGLIKVYAKKSSGKIFGADIVGYNAGEMIAELGLAIENGITLRKIADTIHAYPTYGLGNRRAADQWYVRKQSRLFVKLLQIIFGYHGVLPDTSDPYRIV